MLLSCVYFHQVHVWLAFFTEEGDVVEFRLFAERVGNLRPGELLVVGKLVIAEIAHEVLRGHVSLRKVDLISSRPLGHLLEWLSSIEVLTVRTDQLSYRNDL